MSVLSLRLPDSLHPKVRELAAKESLFVNRPVRYHRRGRESVRAARRGILKGARPASNPYRS